MVWNASLYHPPRLPSTRPFDCDFCRETGDFGVLYTRNAFLITHIFYAVFPTDRKDRRT